MKTVFPCSVLLLILLCPLLMGHNGYGSGETVFASAEKKALHTVLAESLKAMDIPGAIAAVSNPEGEVVTVAAGVARDTEISPEKTFSLVHSTSLLFSSSAVWAGRKWSGVPATSTMHSRIGSVTKMYTAALMLRLQEQGLLDLDDTVSLWLGKDIYPGAGRTTIRQLLNMTSCYVDFGTLEEFLDSYVADPARTASPGQLIELARASEEPVASDEGWIYSNTNYVLAGLIAQKAAGASLAALVRREIIAPLNLGSTVAPAPATLAIPSPFLHGYYRPEDAWQDFTAQSPSNFFAAGNLISTASDVLAFLKALHHGPFLSSASRAEMLDYVSPEDGGEWDGSEDGYGLGIAYVKGATGHKGSLAGYQACAWKYEDRFFVVFINATPEDGSVDDIFWKLARLYYPGAGE